MKTVLLVGNQAEQDAPELQAALGEGYTLLTEKSCAGALKRVTERESIDALFIDEPSRQEGVRELLDALETAISSFHSIPVLLVCDRTTLREDAEFLGGVASDAVVKPVAKA